MKTDEQYILTARPMIRPQRILTIRTFYLSPSEDPKVTKDTLHFLMSFELNRVQRGSKEVFIPVSWQIYSLESLLVKLKLEFNASNRDLYLKKTPLIEGSVNNIQLN